MRLGFRSILIPLAVCLASTALAVPAVAADLQTSQQPAAPQGATALNVETLAENLGSPWSIGFLPDGSILLTERFGRLRVLRDGKLVETPVAGVPETFSDRQAGFFDILVDPDFAQNRRIFLAYAQGKSSDNALRVISATFDGAALSNLKTIYDARPRKDTPVHFGGRLALLPDGTLLITTGDGFDYREKAQKLDAAFGKTVRVNVDGTIPADNPFVNKSGALPEIFTYGHRNVQGLAVDPQSGLIFAHEHGPRGGDEINILAPGKNYGWPIACYCVDYSGARITPYTEYKGVEQPMKYWVPSIAPSGLSVYHGALFPDWDGDLLVGALARTALHRVIMKDGKPVGEERYLVGERVRDVRVGPDGAIYVTTETRYTDGGGKLLRLTPAQ
ncbi:MAG: PQQ-dependent sugar dehydrogenase [Parvularculaceae bacterium]